MEALERRLLLNAAVITPAASGLGRRGAPVLALINESLPDQQLLIQSLPRAEKIFFNPQTESAASILQRTVEAAKELGGGIQAIVIVSHGAAGEFELGDDILSSETLGATGGLWEALGTEMAPGGSIDLFSCDTAEGPLGKSLLDQISALTHAGVFGSTSIIGKDGDWVLNAHSPGAVDAPPPILTNLLTAYPADLGLVTIQTEASATPNPVTGTTTALSVLASDTSGESHVTYSWSATVSPLGSNPTFSINDSNAAKNTTVTFNEAGAYTFTVIASDGVLFATSLVVVTVEQTLTHITVSPSSASMDLNQEQLFTAAGYDQFGNELTIPPLATWSVDPGGVGSMSVDLLGLYSAGDTPGLATVRATSGSVSGTASINVDDPPPSITVPASATPNPVTTTSTLLSVLATDIGGTGNLTYTWAATASPAGSNPTFSTNGTDTSEISTVTFNEAGDYTFTATVSDGFESTTSSVNVTVEQTLTSVNVTPASVGLAPNATQQFAATALDQFGKAMATQPSFTWSLAPLSAGSINSSGLYTAPDTSGTATVLATANTLDIGTASVTVSDTPPTILLPASATPNPVTGTTTLLSVLAEDIGGGGTLTYTWAATSSPAGSDPTYSVNGTTLSEATLVTFDEAGDYTFTVTVSDGTMSTISSVNVTVEQTLTNVSVDPATVALVPNATQQFTATALDQFGNAMATQPGFTWSLAPLSAGSIDSSGLYTAPATSGTATVLATANTLDIGTASVTVSATAPTILLPASATPNPVTGATALLSVLAEDLGGGGTLTYTWAATTEPPGANPSYSINGSALSEATTVTFNEAGDYTFTVTVSDGALFTTSSVNVTVEQTLTNVSVAPGSVALAPYGTQQFAATALDQFGNAMATQPTFTWSLAPLSSGTISSTGLYTAPDTSGTATVLATANTLDIGTASVTVSDTPPTILLPASATPNPVTGTTTLLSVLAEDLGGGGTLTYTWAATAEPTGANPSYSINGSALSAASVVTFNEAGDYTFTVTVSDGTLSTTSSVNVTVEQTLTSVSVAPGSVALAPNATQQFAATALDQFGNAMATPPTFTWSLAPLSSGTISATGLYTAPDTSGTATVLATANTLDIGTASVTVSDTPPTILLPASATPNPVTGTTTLLSVLAEDLGGGGTLIYTWAATSSPSGSDPTYSVNGSALSNTALVTFDQAGNYTFTVTVSDGTLSTTSSVNVTVEQTLTSVSVTPASARLAPNATQQFTATALDQFGDAMATQPTFTWSLAPLSAGSINASGLYTAPDTSGTATVLATANPLDIGTASVTVSDTPPTIVLPASATPNPVTGTTTVLSVLATDLGGLGNLTYTWKVTDAPAGANPTFNVNGTDASDVSTVTFDEAGAYTFLVTVSDGLLSTTSSASVTVEQTLTSVSVTPGNVTLETGAVQRFTAVALDQFGHAMSPQPDFAWSLGPASTGSIDSTGSYTAPARAGTAVVRATVDALHSGLASVIVEAQPAPPITPIPPIPPVPTPPTPVVPTPPITPTPTPTPTPTVTVTPTPTATSTAAVTVAVTPLLPQPGEEAIVPQHSVEPAALDSNEPAKVNIASSFESPEVPQVASQPLFAATLAIATGILAQLLIPGSFLVSLFTSLPAWKWFDPVSILGHSGKPRGRPRVRRRGNSAKGKSNLKDLLQ